MVAVELHVAVRAHVHEHVDVLLSQATELLLRHGERDRRVHEALAETGAAVRRLLVVVAGRGDAGGHEKLLRRHEVLIVAQGLVGEDLAVVAGGVRGDLDAVEAPSHELGDRVVRPPEDVEGVLVLHGAGHHVVVATAHLAEHLVRGPAVLLDLEDVARLLVDCIAGGAHIADHGVPVVDPNTGVARREADSGLDGYEVRVVAESCAARLLGVDRVLDVESLEEPLGRRFDFRILARDEAAAEQHHPAVGSGYIGDFRKQWLMSPLQSSKPTNYS